MRQFQLEIIYITIATVGGIAKYLNSYQQTGKFVWGMFFASCVVSGFSGYMGASFSTLLDMPLQITYVAAGIGGFMGENTLKFIADYFISKKPQNDKTI
jgi:hypothetical protein